MALELGMSRRKRTAPFGVRGPLASRRARPQARLHATIRVHESLEFANICRLCQESANPPFTVIATVFASMRGKSHDTGWVLRVAQACQLVRASAIHVRAGLKQCIRRHTIEAVPGQAPQRCAGAGDFNDVVARGCEALGGRTS